MQSFRKTLLGTVLFGAFALGGVAPADEDRVVEDKAVLVRDVKAVKAALETLKARLNNVELDVLQSADSLEAFREELTEIRHRLGQTLDTQPSASVPPKQTSVSLIPDVATTGAIGRAAGQVPPDI